MKKIAILGAGTVGGSCAQILLRDAAVLEKNAGEALELAYVVDLRDMPDAPFHDKMVKDFAVVEADPEVFLVIEAIGGCGAGGPATASAVLGDVVDIVRNPGRKQPVDWSAEPADLTDPDAFEASFFLRTKLDKAACEQVLGEIRWLPDQNGFHGGFTGKTCKKAIAAAGLALDAVWPVLE